MGARRTPRNALMQVTAMKSVNDGFGLGALSGTKCRRKERLTIAAVFVLTMMLSALTMMLSASAALARTHGKSERWRAGGVAGSDVTAINSAILPPPDEPPPPPPPT